MSRTGAAAEIITVPGAITRRPSGYFCVIDNESLPVGIFTPNAQANSLHDSTARYKAASSPGLRHGHIQLALRLTLRRPATESAPTILVNASAIAIRDPAAASHNAACGAWPIDVAMPRRPVKSMDTTPQSLKGNCNAPWHC